MTREDVNKKKQSLIPTHSNSAFSSITKAYNRVIVQDLPFCSHLSKSQTSLKFRNDIASEVSKYYSWVTAYFKYTVAGLEKKLSQ